MICCLHVEPSPHPLHRLGRLRRLSLSLAAVAGVVLWHPVARPGPVLCLMRNSFALPCPCCGMTRGVDLTLRGQPLEALALNPLILPFLLLLLLLRIKWGAEYALDRKIDLVFRPPYAQLLRPTLYLLLLADWTYLLMFHRDDPFASSWLGRFLHLFY